MRRHLWLLSLLIGFPASAREIPQTVFPAGVGVNIHFVRGHEKDLDLIAAAGFKFIRMDFGWAGIERSKGQYHWDEYDELLGHLDQRGIGAVFILDYSNPLYEPEVTSTNPLTHSLHRTIASPQHEESVAAYAAWAAAAARHFSGRHVIWELWNEPNIDFWSPKPDASQYTAMALAASKAVRKSNPQATLVGPASSGFPWPFLDTFLKSGILEFLDAVSVHPYRDSGRSPETALTDYQRLRALIERYAPPEKKNAIPILSGEWGYSSWQRGVTPEKQADFAVRQQLFNELNGVPLSIWYDWKNDGEDIKENEHNFGTVMPDLQPKPAYTALKTFTQQLAGFAIDHRVSLPNPADFVLACTNASGNTKLVAWTTGETHSVSVPLNAGSRADKGVLGDGVSFSPEQGSGECRFEISSSPRYIQVIGGGGK
ncbi:MAG TPA: cellulase family glycosylhydrolase [Verrucomicrobiae bacterium]|nr:cellulase family glycosylhydrolase [Verrucomicrobiae bacterium]